MSDKIVWINFTEKRKAAIPDATSRAITIDGTSESAGIAIWRLFWLLPLMPMFLLLAICLCMLHRNR